MNTNYFSKEKPTLQHMHSETGSSVPSDDSPQAIQHPIIKDTC